MAIENANFFPFFGRPLKLIRIYGLKTYHLATLLRNASREIA
jgi:hypothetical protein